MFAWQGGATAQNKSFFDQSFRKLSCCKKQVPTPASQTAPLRVEGLLGTRFVFMHCTVGLLLRRESFYGCPLVDPAQFPLPSSFQCVVVVCVLSLTQCFVAVVIAARVPSLLFQTVFDQPFLDLHEAMGLFNGMANDIHGGCHSLLRSVHGH
jgi:hypothetical protein